jgi:hypothetical protein
MKEKQKDRKNNSMNQKPIFHRKTRPICDVSDARCQQHIREPVEHGIRHNEKQQSDLEDVNNLILH